MNEMHPYTVVGVGSGPCCPRVHEHVFAHDAEEAIRRVEVLLNANKLVSSDNERGTVLAAAVFAGHLPKTDPRATTLRADERASDFKREGRLSKRRDFTVVALDPATCVLRTQQVQHVSSANAERNPAFDSLLVGGVVAEAVEPVLRYRSVIGPLVSTDSCQAASQPAQQAPLYRKSLGDRMSAGTPFPL